MSNVATIEKTTTMPAKPAGFGAELAGKITQFSAALPKHIPQERFARVIMTAVQRNPDLLRADRQSLWNSAMQAAADGLLPDGREGALVVYHTKALKQNKNDRDVWIQKVQWLPMIAGIRKKVRNSGEIIDWTAHVVHAKDEFAYELGDDPFIKHKPFMGGDRGPVIAAYSVATLKGGEKSREVMTRADLDKVKAASKSADTGPWKTWYEEMCRKSVAKRHAKVLPMSTDLDDLIRRDDELYDLKGASDAVAGSPRLSLHGKLDALAAMPDPEQGDQPAPEETAEGGQDTAVPADEAPANGPVTAAQAAEGAGPDKDQTDGTEVASSPAAAPDDPARDAVLAKLRAAATNGSQRLKFAIGKLSVAEHALLSDEEKARLETMARSADKGSAG